MGAPVSRSSYSGKGSSRRPSIHDNESYKRERAVELNLRDSKKVETRNEPEISEIFEKFTEIETQKEVVNAAYRKYRSEQSTLDEKRKELKSLIEKLEGNKRESFENLMNAVDPIGGDLDDIDK